jgi:hippurate hydrolase
MPVVNRIAGYAQEMTQWRRHLHTIPELGRACFKTAAFVEEKLREFGVDEIQTGFATTGLVAIINGQGEGPTIGLRADMDGLPIIEATDLDYQSTHDGRMHACGHDGHTTMLLGAAKYLAETRNFAGRVALIFQPDEEATGGAEAMVEEGIMDIFDIAQVYGIHNAPDFPEGGFFTASGPLMAAADTFDITITGRGGHGANPHDTVDPVLAACSVAQAIQTIVSRNVDASKQLVISVTQIHTGTVDNVIPETAYINGTVRTFEADVRDMAERRLEEIVAGQAASYGCSAVISYNRGYPPTVNTQDGVVLATQAARDVSGENAVEDQMEPVMGSEDFGYMLEKRPGAYLFMGQGASAGLHHPEYNFNDEVAPIGASFFARLVETAQPVKS